MGDLQHGLDVPFAVVLCALTWMRNAVGSPWPRILHCRTSTLNWPFATDEHLAELSLDCGTSHRLLPE